MVGRFISYLEVRISVSKPGSLNRKKPGIPAFLGPGKTGKWVREKPGNFGPI